MCVGFFQGLRQPHDIEVDPVNLRVYVGELDPTKVWRFDMKADDGTGGRGNIIHSECPQRTGECGSCRLVYRNYGSRSIKLQFLTNLHLHCREYKIGLVSNYMYLLG